jgi:hypothetical protein
MCKTLQIFKASKRELRPSLNSIKGKSAASVRNMATEVWSEQLISQFNVDVKNNWSYTTTTTHQACIKFQKIKEPFKNYKI